MEQELNNLLAKAKELIAKETRLDNLEKIRVKWLGKKGFVAVKARNLSTLPKEDKPKFGQLINDIKKQVQETIDIKKAKLEKKYLANQIRREYLDVTMPGRQSFLGSRHPISIAREKIEDFFAKVGFVVELGPEIEDDFHNFEALNIAKNHPARAMQDTFYITEDKVLRTHTSNVQIRTMETQSPPLRMIAPGRVYRSDSDLTHTPMFHQIEGMWIDKKVTFADLKGTLIAFLCDFFDDNNLQIRFRPSYFPFTEPSAEVDIKCSCQGDDNSCRICRNTGWLEVLGAGMMHPKVLENGGINSKKYRGYAFGMGIERLAMLSYKINDLRIFFDNDMRFLSQFK